MMEEKRTVFSYIGQMFSTYGVMVVIFIVFCMVLDESTGEYSTLFELAGRGLTINTLLQLLFLALIVTVSQVVFLTDTICKNLSMVLRNVFFFSTILIAVILFACIFAWFPIGDVRAWIGFGISFAVSMAVSIFITRIVEKTENSKMQEALEKYNKGK